MLTHLKMSRSKEQNDLSAFVVEDHSGENLSLSEIEAKKAVCMEKMENGHHRCKVCQYTSDSQTVVREHLDKHIKFNYNCNQCDKKLISQCSYRKHMSLHKKQSL